MLRIYLIRLKDGLFLSLSVYWEEFLYSLSLLLHLCKELLSLEAACFHSLMILSMLLIKPCLLAIKSILDFLYRLECLQSSKRNIILINRLEICAFLAKNIQANKHWKKDLLMQSFLHQLHLRQFIKKQKLLQITDKTSRISRN